MLTEDDIKQLRHLYEKVSHISDVLDAMSKGDTSYASISPEFARSELNSIKQQISGFMNTEATQTNKKVTNGSPMLKSHPNPIEVLNSSQHLPELETVGRNTSSFNPKDVDASRVKTIGGKTLNSSLDEPIK
ncbi:MAG: hypothetical protein ACRC5C_13115, partial [Bacilli bacterium]